MLSQEGKPKVAFEGVSFDVLYTRWQRFHDQDAICHDTPISSTSLPSRFVNRVSAYAWLFDIARKKNRGRE